MKVLPSLNLWFQRELMHWKICSGKRLSRVLISEHVWNQNYLKIGLMKPKSFMKVSPYRICFKKATSSKSPIRFKYFWKFLCFWRFQSLWSQMKASHALMLLRKSILVYLLSFSLLEFFHYSVLSFTKLNYEKFSIPGRMSLFSIFKFLSKSSMPKTFNCESLIKDWNGMELIQLKKP